MDNILSMYLYPAAIIAAKSVFLITTLLITIAFLLLADRKIWAAVQMRRGPNVVGAFGLLQSFADLLKFVLKEKVLFQNLKTLFYAFILLLVKIYRLVVLAKL